MSISIKTLDRSRYNKLINKSYEKKSMRVFLDGKFTLTSKIAKELDLKNNSHIELFIINSKLGTNIYLAKSNKKTGFEIKRNRNSFQFNCKGLADDLFKHFKFTGSEKSLRLTIKPEPYTINQKSGYLLFEVVRN